MLKVMILRPKVHNSHAQWRDFRQVDKSIIDLATRVPPGPIQDLLCDLLNQGNDEVREAHEVARRSSILPMGQEPTDTEVVTMADGATVEDGQDLAKSVPEKLDLDFDMKFK